MLQSMTGYTGISFSLENSNKEIINFETSLKSLNSRYFEIHIKMPPSFYPIEHKIVKILKKSLKRGSIYLTINCLDPDKLMNKINVCFGTLNSYVDALNGIKTKYNINDDIKFGDIIRLPNIFSSSDMNLTQDQEEKILEKMRLIAENLVLERSKEGSELEKDISSRIDSMENNIEAVKQEFERHFQDKQNKINEQLNNLVKDSNEGELVRNYLYSVLDKMDITEEIVRFQSHLKKIKEVIGSNILEKGKTLDFTFQELGREINTILSKTPSTLISNIALNVKVEIEKSREQIQNII